MGRVQKENKRILKSSPNSDGYLMVNINEKQLYVHRLVAKAFVPNPHHFNVVNHKDEDKGNDMANNLEWCTSKYNDRYGRHAWKQIMANFYSVKISKGIAMTKIFPTMKAANFWLRAYGGIHLSQYTVKARLRRCCWGEVQDVYGYSARFIPTKGSSLQLSLFDKPKQMTLFGRD